MLRQDFNKGWKFNSFIAASILSRVSGRTLLLSFKYFDTTATESPASFATSLITAKTIPLFNDNCCSNYIIHR
jgi:hypothetical protein